MKRFSRLSSSLQFQAMDISIQDLPDAHRAFAAAGHDSRTLQDNFDELPACLIEKSR
jgi:hypothetical protein